VFDRVHHLHERLRQRPEEKRLDGHLKKHFERSNERAEKRGDEDYDEETEEEMLEEDDFDAYILNRLSDIIHSFASRHIQRSVLGLFRHVGQSLLRSSSRHTFDL
jgi:hypothetical protein